MAVPKVAKVIVNIGMGEGQPERQAARRGGHRAGTDHRAEARVTRAKKSIANFKIRRGMPIGCCVTLRGDRMYEFLDRLCNVVLPRVRDFRGLPPNAFDGARQLHSRSARPAGVSEIDYTRVDKIKGMNITLTTTAKNDERGANC